VAVPRVCLGGDGGVAGGRVRLAPIPPVAIACSGAGVNARARIRHYEIWPRLRATSVSLAAPARALRA
jgi:hypothetical protein